MTVSSVVMDLLRNLSLLETKYASIALFVGMSISYLRIMSRRYPAFRERSAFQYIFYTEISLLSLLSICFSCFFCLCESPCTTTRIEFYKFLVVLLSYTCGILCNYFERIDYFLFICIVFFHWKRTLFLIGFRNFFTMKREPPIR